MSTDTKQSDAMIFLSHMWNCANDSKLFSWERLNFSMSQALELAIYSGMEFADGDFNKIAGEFRLYRWSSCENAYTEAVKVNNMSCCKSLESYLKLKPFIAKFPIHYGGYGMGRETTRQEGRIAWGAEFTWQGKQVKVTSLAKDYSYLIACSYPPYDYKDGEYKERKPDHIFKISHDDLKTKN